MLITLPSLISLDNMKFSNHNHKKKADSDDLVVELQLASDSEQIKGLKNLEFFLRKPFCGSGRAC